MPKLAPLLAFPALALAACAPAIKAGDLKLSPEGNERFAMLYVMALDTTGDDMTNLPEICIEGKGCPEPLGAYSSDARKFSGNLLLLKSAEANVKITGINIRSSLGDDMGKTSIGPGMRYIRMGFTNFESPLAVPGNDKTTYDYFTATFETTDGAPGVRVKPAESCPRVDGVYLGSYIVQFKDAGMPAPDIKLIDATSLNLHIKQAALLKYRAADTFNCYAVVKKRPVIKGDKLSIGP